MRSLDKKTKSRIIVTLRKLSTWYAPRADAKKKRKVDPATFKCDHCSIIIYEGKKTLEKTGLLEKYDNVICVKSHMDHIIPVVDPAKGWDGWDQFITRLFCDESNFQLLCPDCHKIKSNNDRKKVDKK